MPTTVNTPLRSDYGFKSPSFNVDLNGNITATTITLTTDCLLYTSPSPRD